MKKALLIIDYQNELVDPGGKFFVKGADLIKPYLELLINEYNAYQYPIIGVQIKFNQTICDQIRQKKSNFKNCFMDEAWGSEWAIPIVLFKHMITKSEQLIKGETSPFYHSDGIESSELNQLLKNQNIEEVTVCGVRLNVGVSSAARDLVKLGYKTVIDLQASCGDVQKINLY